MEWKPSEIIILVIAFAIPTALFGALLIPGVMGGLFSFLFAPQNMQVVFVGLAVLVAAILAMRIFRRIRPKPPGKPGEDRSITSLFRDPNKS